MDTSSRQYGGFAKRISVRFSERSLWDFGRYGIYGIYMYYSLQYRTGLYWPKSHEDLSENRIPKFVLPNLPNGGNFSATFMDFMKAFDRVWHTGLLYKLAQCGISLSSLAWIRDYLSNRHITVQVDGSKSLQLRCHKDLTSGLYSLWCLLMTYHLTPNRLQLNFMLMTPSYINCTPDAKNFLSCRFRMRSRQQKTGHCHGTDDSAAQKQKWWLHYKIVLLNIKLHVSTSRTRR